MANRYMKKMFNIMNQQANVNQSHREISFHPSKIGYYQKDNITSASKDVEQSAPLHTLGGNVNQYSHCGKQYVVSLEKIKL